MLALHSSKPLHRGRLQGPSPSTSLARPSSRSAIVVVQAHRRRGSSQARSRKGNEGLHEYNFVETHRNGKTRGTSPARGAPTQLAAQGTPGAGGSKGGASASSSHASYNFVDTHRTQSNMCGGSNSVPLSQCRALVLDCAYRPIDVVNWQRAITLDMFDKVDVLQYYDDKEIYSPNDVHQLPAVLKVRMYVKKNKEGGLVNLSKRNIFIRDKYTCQYCGSRSKLTVDHVVPVSKGGPWSWNNLVAACAPCNSFKGDKDLHTLPNMKLKKQPKTPGAADVGLIAAMSMREVFAPPPEWADYLVAMDKTSALHSVVEDLLEQQEMRRRTSN